MAKTTKNAEILAVPKAYINKIGVRKPKNPEVVRLYNTFRDLLQQSHWDPQFIPLSLEMQYPRWELLLATCQAQNIDAQAYLKWIFAERVLSHPRGFLPFALANGTLWRFKKQGKITPARYRDFGNRLIDDRTGQAVDWIFDSQGQPLISPPTDGEVYDEQGNPIPLRRFS